MSTVSIPYPKPNAWRRRAARAAAAPAAAMAVSVAWLVADKAAGVDLHQPGFGSHPAQSLSAGLAAAVAALAALAGWGVLAVLERRGSRGAAIWLRTALAVLVLSLAGPLSGHGVGTGDRLTLVCMHLAASAVIIPLLYYTASARHQQSRQ